MRTLTLQSFQAFQATLDDQPVDFRGAKERALLIYLALEQGTAHPPTTARPTQPRFHTRSALAGLLWPDEPEAKARRHLSTSLLHLRNAIGDRTADADRANGQSFLLVENQALSINPAASLWLDALALRASLAAIDAHEHPRLHTCAHCTDQYRQAVDLYGGPFLDDFEVESDLFEEWRLGQQAHFAQLALDACAQLSACYVAQGQIQRAIAMARRQLHLEPTYEEAHRTLMQLLAQSGQRSAALAQYDTLTQILMDELGVPPAPETDMLYDAIVAGEIGGQSRSQPFGLRTNTEFEGETAEVTGQSQSEDHITDPPAMISEIIGRAVEVNQLSELLKGHNGRLITLVGPPGVGKTTLAIEIARQLHHRFRNGTRFISLAVLSQPEKIASLLVTALGIRDISRKPNDIKLFEFLRHKEILLVLDNFEQIISAAPLVAKLLTECPKIRILVTSRERLQLLAEKCYEVPPLTPESAIDLFTLRAQTVDVEFTPDREVKSIIRKICGELDYLPLAIELSASQSDLFAPQQLLTRLRKQKLDLMNRGFHDRPERQRTLRNAIRYSYELLDEQEKHLLRVLGGFVGGFELEAVRAFGFQENSLRLLLDKSLVNREGLKVDRIRFSLLETVREFACEELERSGEMASVLERHLHFYAEQAEKIECKLVSDEYIRWLELLDSDYGNYRIALATAAKLENTELQLRLASALRLYWHWRALISEGRSYLFQALQMTKQLEPDGTTAKAYFTAGYLAYLQADRSEALEALSKSAEIYRYLQNVDKLALILAWQGKAQLALGEYQAALESIEESETLFRLSNTDEAKQGLPFALHVKGYIKSAVGDLNAARDLSEESLSLYRLQNDQKGIAQLLYRMGHLDLLSHNYESAYARFVESLATYQKSEDQLTTAAIHYFLGYILRRRNRYMESVLHLGKALQLYNCIGNTGSVVGTLTELAKVASRQNQFLRAARLFAKAGALRDEIQENQWKALPAERKEYEEFLEQLRSELEPKVLEREWSIGITMSIEQTIDFSLSASQLDASKTSGEIQESPQLPLMVSSGTTIELNGDSPHSGKFGQAIGRAVDCGFSSASFDVSTKMYNELSDCETDKRSDFVEHGYSLNKSDNSVLFKIPTLERLEGSRVDKSVHFVAGPPITQPHRFFGREEALSRIFGWWQAAPLAHVALIGPRRCGKTSLLRHLQSIVTVDSAHLRSGQRSDWLPSPERYRWVEIDFQDPRMRVQTRLLRRLLTGFGLDAPADCSLETFMDVAESHTWTQPIIVLMDELGAGLAAPELEQPFWWMLRSLSQWTHGQLAFVVAAHDQPVRLAEEEGKVSPFFNIFTTLKLGPFTQDEALKLMATSPTPFGKDDVAWILEQSGRWPYLLQILCQERLSSHKNGEEDEQWKARGLARIEPFAYLKES